MAGIKAVAKNGILNSDTDTHGGKSCPTTLAGVTCCKLALPSSVNARGVTWAPMADGGDKETRNSRAPSQRYRPNAD